ncbi:hypothetical protein C0989_000473 [Termitomyces sp. Mn162]|nr:hypothetical protein C0989_000473 [Termitomyces sp. Mn162]
MSDLTSQLEKIIMACAFLSWVDHLLAVARASLAKDCYLAVTAIFQTWLQWFKTAESGVEWLELANVERECCQFYEQYKGEEWVCPFDVHFALVNPSLEFLIDDLTAGMTVSAPAVTSASNTTKHPVGALVVARREKWSKGHGGKERVNCGNITEEGPSTPKAVAGSIARGLAILPRLVTTPRGKEEGKGKSKAQEEDDKDIEEQIEERFSDKRLVTLFHWQKVLMVVDTGLGAGVVLMKAKGKVTVLLEKRQEFKCTQGADVEMRKMTPLVTVAEVECKASDIEVESKEFKAAPVAIEEEKNKVAKGTKVQQRGTWRNMPLCQVGNDKLEWLSKDLAWLMLLTPVTSLADFNERVAEVEQRF